MMTLAEARAWQGPSCLVDGGALFGLGAANAPGSALSSTLSTYRSSRFPLVIVRIWRWRSR
jgi:hypothetical protein